MSGDEGDDGNGRDELASLLLDIKEGKPGARDRLFALLADESRQGAVILAMARKALPRGHWARVLIETRDIVQSALGTGWFSIGSFRGETDGEFFAWFRSILRTKVHRASRKERPRAALPPESVDPPVPHGPPDLLEAVLDAEMREGLRKAIDGLPEREHVVIALRLQGHDAREIGQVLGIQHAAVRQRESRAVKRLRAALKKVPLAR